MNNPQLAPEGEALLPCPLCSQQLQPAADHRMAGMLEHPAGLPLCPISALCFNDTPEMRALWNRRELGSTGAVAPEPAAWRYHIALNGNDGLPHWSAWMVSVGPRDPSPAIGGRFEVEPLFTHPAPADTGQGGRETALADVAAERERQKAVEGWTPEHDDEHLPNDLSCAAACYTIPTLLERKIIAHHWTDASRYMDAEPEPVGSVEVPALWPWDGQWWKPKDQRRNLVKAAALIIAEIERLDRAALDAGART